jgi:colicin import membrane protein
MKSKRTLFEDISWHLRSCVVLVAFMISLPPATGAQDRSASEPGPSGVSSAGIAERYPAGSIRSVETADQALTDVQQERSRLEAEFADEERQCHSRFFVTACIDAAKEARRQALADVQKVEVQANAFKRRARVEERDRALAEKAPKPTPIVKSAPSSKTDSPVHANDGKVPASSGASERKRAQRADAARERIARHNAKLERLKAKEAEEAQMRAQNVADYEKKRRDAEERQREVAARKAEKERESAANPPLSAPTTSN